MFHTLTIRTRLAIGYAVLLLLLVILATTNIVRLNAVGHHTDYVLKEKLRNERMITEWMHIIEMNIPRSVAAGKTSDPDLERQFLAEISEASQRATALQDQLEARITDPDAKQRLEYASAVRATYRQARERAFALKAAGDTAAAKAFFDGEYVRRAKEYAAAIHAVLERQHQLIDNTGKEIHAENADSILLAIVLAALASVVSICAAVYTGRSIVRQLGGEPTTAARIADRIAQGDLAVEIELSPKDKSSVLYSMKMMQDSLSEIVTDVRSGTDSMSASAAEIANGSMDLSGRTEQQAAAIEETASSMEELTTTVQQNAEHARQADALARAASAVSQRSGQAMQQLEATMHEIHGASRQIVDIITVIDGIAFQTNILALNAAVEAARAGDQGRGFAVVASEVRTLAQRSAAAAKEIAALISNSVAKVEGGTRQVTEAGRTVAEVATSVERVTGIIGEIAVASAEQSAGIEQINRAVGEMDTMTQANAALVEESAAAAQSMRSQSDRLAELVRRFQVSARAYGADSAHVPPRATAARTRPRLVHAAA